MSRTHFRVNPEWPLWLNGWVFVYELSGCGFVSHCSHLVFNALCYCLSGSTILPLVVLIYPLIVLVCPLGVLVYSLIVLVCQLVVLVCPFLCLLIVLVCPSVVSTCPLVVLVWPFICPLVVLVVLSVGLFITDPYNDNKMIILMNII